VLRPIKANEEELRQFKREVLEAKGYNYKTEIFF
jgi:hypothetical protein